MQIILTVAGAIAGVVYFAYAGPFYRFRLPLAVLMGIIGIAVVYFFFFNNLRKIKIDSEGIEFRHIVTGKQDYVAFDDIEKIDMDAFQIENANGPLTEPVPEVEIKTFDAGSYFILSNVYANFYPMVKEILAGYNRATDKKIDAIARRIFDNYLKNIRYGQGKQKTD